LLALLTDSSNFINVTSSNNYYGFYLGFSNNNTIANSTASLNIQNGVYLSYSDSNTLANNTISSNTGYGVYLYSSTNNTVEYNVIDLNNGIYTETSSQVYGNIYRGNTITNASYAFYFYEGDNAEMYNMTIEDNLITNTSTGLYLDSFYFDTYDFIIKNNTIRDSSYGLYICGSYVFNFTISGNTIRDITWDGISLDSPHDNIISNNIITGCGSDGISLYSSGNAVYNNFFNNTNNVYVMGTNSWNTTKQAGTNIVGGSYLGGNFWAKPDGTGFSENCTDVDSDGICDSYYNISSGNIDWLPLTTPGGGFEVPSDVIPPVVKISNPENNSVINIFNDLVNGTVTDNVAVDTIRVILNGVEVKTWSSLGTSNTTFALAVNYTEGTNNTILVIANDTFGNTGSSTVVVTVLNRTVKKTINVTANETVTIDITNQTDTELEIFTYTNVSGDINVTAGTDIADVNVTVPMNATHGLATDEVPLGKFIAIEASDVIQQNITWAILRMYYSLVDLDRNGNGVLGDAEDVKPESLKLYWYNDSGNKWEPLIKGANYTPDGPYVYSNDVNQTPYGGYLGSVWANVSHYSVYGIAGSVYGVGGAVYGVSGAVEGEIKSQVVAEPGYIRIITGHVMSGKAKIFSIPSTVDVFVTELGFVAKKWLSGIISIETLLEKPRGVSSAPGRVFKYIDITPLQIKSDDIEAMSISFKVEKSWLEKNSIDLEAVALYRFAGTWEKLDTVKIREDDVFVYYSATSSGFSYYAISGAVKLPLETTAPVTAPPATAAPSITTLPPTPPLTAAPTLLPTTTPPPAPVLPSTLKIILILGIIAGIAAVTYYLVKRQQ
jgi:PGF-pre-PGF domain-containing protein